MIFMSFPNKQKMAKMAEMKIILLSIIIQWKKEDFKINFLSFYFYYKTKRGHGKCVTVQNIT